MSLWPWRRAFIDCFFYFAACLYTADILPVIIYFVEKISKRGSLLDMICNLCCAYTLDVFYFLRGSIGPCAISSTIAIMRTITEGLNHDWGRSHRFKAL